MVRPKILIINSCSKSKKISHNEQSTCKDLTSIEKREYQKMKFKDILTPAGKMYTGHQAQAIQRAVELLKNKHEVDYYIISAGFGFVHESDQLPPYECSFANLKKQQIREMSCNLNIESDIKRKIVKLYDVIYLALGIDYLTAISDIGYLESKTNLLIHFNRNLKPKKKLFYVNDVYLVKNVSKFKEKIFTTSIGAQIASKGTILENYALELQENDNTIIDNPFDRWISNKFEKMSIQNPI